MGLDWLWNLVLYPGNYYLDRVLGAVLTKIICTAHKPSWEHSPKAKDFVRYFLTWRYPRVQTASAYATHKVARFINADHSNADVDDQGLLRVISCLPQQRCNGRKPQRYRIRLITLRHSVPHLPVCVL